MCEPGMVTEPGMNQSRLIETTVTSFQMIMYWKCSCCPDLNICTLALLIMTILTAEKQFLTHQKKQSLPTPRGCLPFSKSAITDITLYFANVKKTQCEQGPSVVLTCSSSFQYSTRITATAMQITLKIDANKNFASLYLWLHSLSSFIIIIPYMSTW